MRFKPLLGLLAATAAALTLTTSAALAQNYKSEYRMSL